MYEAIAERYGIPADVLDALIRQESGGNPQAIGDRGNSFGLGQFNTKGALADFGLTGDQVLAMPAEKQADLTAQFLAQKIKQAGGDVWGGVKRYNGGGDPNYVQNVQRQMNVGFRRADPDVRMAGGNPSQMAPGEPRSGRMFQSTPSHGRTSAGMVPMNTQGPQLPPFPQMSQAPAESGPTQSLMNPIIALIAGLASGGGGFKANLGNAGAASTAMQTAENDLYELRSKREDVTRKRNQSDSLSKWFSQMAETPGLEDVGAMGMADPAAGMQLYAAKQKAQQEAAQREQAARTLEQQGRSQDAALVRSGAALGSVSNQVQASNEYYAPIPIAGPDNSTIYRQFSKGGGFTDFDGQGRPLSRDPKAERELAKQKAAGTFEGTQGAKEQLRQEKLGPVLDEIGEKIKQSTGSGIGAMIDSAARWFGVSTPGSLAIAELEPLAARLMLAGERLEGPQSDADRVDLKAAAGNIANPNIPTEQRQRSFDVIKRLSKKYNLDEVDAKTGAPAASGWKIERE